MSLNSIFAQEEPTAAPQIKTFSTNPDNLGALANSVNLFSGDVALPLNLVSLPGRNGLDVNVSISYSSAGLHKSVGTWNLEAPTGILGLGWSMDYPKIIVDNKNTGARDDDEFYLVEGGTTNRLVCVSEDVGIKKYKLKNYQFWDIEYHYPYDIYENEKWIITKENGVKYIYGDYENHPTAVQYLIKWGNWIGSSSLVAGQEKQAMVWNLSEVVDTWGNNVTYEYLNVERKVGDGTSTGGGTEKHTEASYLKKIEDSFGRIIEFFYADKEYNTEILEPHIEAGSEKMGGWPDAYQERYETKYLDYISVKSSTNYLLSKTIFNYNENNFIDASTNKEKRLLESITQQNGSGQSLPDIKFSYLANGNKGALETVTTPSGGIISYNYELQTITNKNWYKYLSPPEVGYSKPLAWNANDYVVVTWRNGTTIKVCVYEWDGEWIGGEIKTITDVPENIESGNPDEQRIQVSLQKDFFALSHDKYIVDIPLIGYQTETKLYIFSKDETKASTWNNTSTSFTHFASGKARTPLVTGNSFAAVRFNAETSMIIGYEKRNSVWVEKTFATVYKNDSKDFLFISAANNFLWIHNTAPDPNNLTFFYLDELNNWQTRIVANTWYTSLANWHSNNFSTMSFWQGRDERFWTWDENYNNFTVTTYQAVDDWSRAFMMQSGMTGIADPVEYWFGRAFAYYGDSDDLCLENMTPHVYHPHSAYAYSQDFVVKKMGNLEHSTKDWRIYNYNANSISWSNSPLTSTINNPQILAGNNFYVFDNKVYFKQTNESFTQLTTTLSSDAQNFTSGQNFFRYNFWPSGTLNGSHLYLIKNGDILNSTPINISESNVKQLTTANTIVGHAYPSTEDGNYLKLYRIIGEDQPTNQTHYAVSRIDLNDGYETKFTSYDYYPNYGTIDPSGSVAKYNKVRVRPGTSSGSEAIHPFGYTDTYFYNGLVPSSFAKSIPDDEFGSSNAQDYYKLLTGMPYLVEAYEDGDDNNPVSKKENFYYVYSKTINSETGYYSRIKKIVETQDVALETNFTYDASTGVMLSKYFDNLGSNGLETLSEYYIYGSEEYSYLADNNILSPVIQTKTFTDGTCTNVSATTWTNTLGGNWAPHKTYIYSVPGNVDFTNWTTGTPNSNWVKTSEVISRDSDGNVLEIMDVNEIHSVTKFGFDSAIPIASITNSTNSESKVELCQESRSISQGDLAPNFNYYKNGSGGTVTYSIFDELYRGKVQKVISNGVTGSGGVNINMGTLSSSKNYIIEFDVNVVSGEIEILSFSTGKGYTSQDYLNNATWEHYSYLWDMGGNGASSQIWIRSKWNTSGSSATFYIDNVRIYPEDGFVNSTNYDPVYFDAVSNTNAQGVNTFYEYDSFRRPIRIRNNNLDILTETIYFLSRESYTDFNTSYPNYTEVGTPALNGVSRTYSDGFGKTRQSQSKASSTDMMISEILYDELGRGYIQTKPTKVGLASFLYHTGFVTGFSNNQLSGAVQSANNDYYAYTRTKYENSPLGRVIETGLPGLDFIVGSGHTSRMGYSTNGSEFSGFSSGNYLLATSTDPNGVVSYSMKDKMGNLIAEKIDPQGISSTTTYKYDDYHNLTHIYPPNYHNPPSGMTASDYVINMTYDHLGRLKTQESPDADIVRYIYDKAGRTRFMIDGNGLAASPYDNILYWKYDNLGRTIEEGFISNLNWSESTLQNYADNTPTYPSTPTTWRKKYSYGDISNQYNYGQLVKVEVNNDASSDTEVEETYSYDIYSNVKDKGIRIVDYNNIEKTISYEYDILGNVTRVSYMPIDLVIEDETITGEAYYEAADEVSVGDNFTVSSTGSLTLKAGMSIKLLPGFSVLEGGTLTTLFGGEGSADVEETQVVYSYDMMGRIEKIGTTDDDDFFAAYTYGVNGNMYQEKLNNNGVTRTYTYEKPGWLKQIDDSFFKEELSYTSGGYGGAGYYNGNIAKAVYDLKWSGNNGDFNVLYKYDKLNRLLVADNTLSGKDVGVGNEISYDANGNLKDLVRNSGTNNYTYYSGTNKVQNVDGSGNDYTYDSNGNITAVVNKDLDNFNYDPFTNLTTSIRDISGSANTFSFSYGANDQRVYKNANFGIYSPSIAYFHGLSDFPLMEKHEIEGEPEVTKLYVYGPTGLIAVNDDEGWFFMLKDHLGSNRVVVNESNSWVANYDFMPYGDIMKSAINTNISYQFTGQEMDTETGLHNFRARMYDSDLGMFYAMDPAGQGYSPFAYANGNPIMYVDPDGENPLLFAAALIAGSGALNAIFNWDKIETFEDFSGFFALGAGTATMALVSGGSGIGILTSANLLYAGNAILREEPITQEGFLITSTFAIATFGIANVLTNKPFFYNFAGADAWLPTIGNVKPLAEGLKSPNLANKPAQLPKSNISGLLDESLTSGGQVRSIRILPNPEVPSNINIGQQGKHLFGHNNFRSGNSILNTNPQKLLDGVNKGQFKILRVHQNKVIVDFGKTIGNYYYNNVFIGPTRYGTIHYGSSGAHIVPANPIQF